MLLEFKDVTYRYNIKKNQDARNVIRLNKSVILLLQMLVAWYNLDWYSSIGNYNIVG